GTPYCNDPICCATVCALDPTCCDSAWTQDCVDLANEFCFECGDADAGSCFTANFTPACDDVDCCMLVSTLGQCCATIDMEFTCFISTQMACADVDGDWTDFGCGEGVWDERCAIVAGLVCDQDPLADTPDLSSFQAYLSEAATPGFEVLSRSVLGTEEFTGEGLDLSGLESFADELMATGGGSNQNGARGRGIKVAVIEPSAYVNHEDLDVNVEPGQTPWINPATDPQHGTAVLGIIGAMDQDDPLGMVGVAPDAELWFFPTFSLEDGFREQTAIANALLELGQGDVMNFSVGPTNNNDDGDCTFGLLTNSFTNLTLINMGTGLGITSVIAAGDDCCSLDEVVGSTGGAWVVGGCDPGRMFCRRPSSNHSAEGEDMGFVFPPDISAWGDVVATTGGNGDLWGSAAQPERQYTTSFDGTSAASPMVAGAIACLQGVARQFFGIPLQPGQIRSVRAGIPQCGSAGFGGRRGVHG
ncbi:MAG: S8 family serine peptidase, partial [Planctomycetota bacterium]